MDANRWRQIESICQAALDLEPDQRVHFLDKACAGDEHLRYEVESLLTYEEPAKQFIEIPPDHIAAEMLANKQTEDLRGQQIAYYKILDLIGKGGMGEVYLAEDIRLGRKIALKLLLREFTTDHDRMKRFKREAQAASALNDPHILTVHDIGEDRNLHYIATEFIEGQTLRQKLTPSKKIALFEALDIMIQVAMALTKAHEADIVHRDIKPENIMVRSDSLVKVLDFGLAKLTHLRTSEADENLLSNEDTETASGIVMGTVTYMSPEQSRGKKVDARSDIFSFGIVLYEMITGTLPFPGETLSDKLACLLEREHLPLTEFISTIPLELERIVRKTLRKNPDERYQTIKDVMLDLKYLQENLRNPDGVHKDIRKRHEGLIKWGNSIRSFANTVKSYKKAFVVIVLIALISTFILIWNNKKPENGLSPAVDIQTQPFIFSISPDSPLDIIGDQTLLVTGSGFQDALVVNVKFPNGGNGQLSGAQIHSVNANSFALVIDFNGNPGQYVIQVVNSNGKSSDPFTFVAQHKVLDPVISSIIPSNPPANNEEQNILVYGHNFQVGLEVNVTFPNGQTSVLKGRQIPYRTPSSFRMLIYFNGDPGKYIIQVVNPNGRKSNPFTFKVG